MSYVKSEIEKLIENKNLTVGIAIYDKSNGDTLNINGEGVFPMQSVFKFPVALCVLSEVDKGRWSIDENVVISQKELLPDTWSPIRDKYPNQDVVLPLSEVIKYTVSQSDNNGCDILIAMLGGTEYVDKYVGVENIKITHNEHQMHTSWDNQFDNWATPKAMIELLKLFDDKKLLKPETQSFLWQTMAETVTGSIKNRLPKTAVVAHKTGSSGYNANGVCAATNDVGIMVLPDGRHILYAIFITNSTEREEVNYSIISEIGALLYQNL